MPVEFCRALRRVRSVLFAALFLIGCRPFAAGAYEWVVLPATTDPTISNVYPTNAYHFFAIDTNVPAKGRLQVFFPGTGGIPLAYVSLLRASAALGYHTIGLTYMNSNAVNEICATTNDLSCHDNVRLETIDGIDRSALLTVNRANSIENRLFRLLSWLSTNSIIPVTRTQGWDQYLQGTNIVWSNIIVAGHSQGGGHAAMIAKTRRVARCNMFAWGDFVFTNVVGRPADWLSWTSATPAEAYFGFGHAEDTLSTSTIVVRCWTALGLDPLGPIVPIESNPAPYLVSHRLMTWVAPKAGGTEHGAVAVEGSTPVSGTNAVFQPVWDYLLAAPALAPTALSVSVSATNVVVRFPTLTGSAYQLQRTTNFVQYTNLGARITGNGNMQTGIAGTVSGPAFYRVQVPY